VSGREGKSDILRYTGWSARCRSKTTSPSPRRGCTRCSHTSAWGSTPSGSSSFLARFDTTSKRSAPGSKRLSQAESARFATYEPLHREKRRSSLHFRETFARTLRAYVEDPNAIDDEFGIDHRDLPPIASTRLRRRHLAHAHVARASGRTPASLCGSDDVTRDCDATHPRSQLDADAIPAADRRWCRSPEVSTESADANHRWRVASGRVRDLGAAATVCRWRRPMPRRDLLNGPTPARPVSP
jgi:hypothetical protein